MKKLIISALVFFLISPAFAQWTVQSSGTGINLKNIYFTDTLNGYCAGGGDNSSWPLAGQPATLLKTTDGGNTWHIAFQNSLLGLSSIIAFNDTVLAFGMKATGQQCVVYSTNGGVDWDIDTLSFWLTDNVKKKVIKAGNQVYLLSDNGGIYRMSSFNNWISLPSCPVSSVFYAVGNKIFSASGPPHRLYKSDDGGISWDSSSINPANPISPSPYSGSSIWVFGDTVMLYTTYPYIKAYSFDNGLTWNTDVDTFGSRFSLYNFSANEFIGSYNGNIFNTYDGGMTYNYSQPLADVKDVYFLNRTLGFICGDGGVIYKTTTGGGTTSISNQELKKKLKIYPNPTNEKINIEYENSIEVQSIQLVDVSGNLVRSFKRNEKMLNVSGVSNGVYFLNIRSKEGVIVEKVIIQ